jgi:hypothetical protein
VPETGKRLKSGQKLGHAYMESNLPLCGGGAISLAAVLNESFAGK